MFLSEVFQLLMTDDEANLTIGFGLGFGFGMVIGMPPGALM